MGWFNYVGLIIIVLIMVPNVVYALKHRSQGNNNVPTYVVVLENLGRYASMFFLVFNIPNTWFSFFVPTGMLFYILVNSVLVVTYIALFIAFWNKTGMAKALWLSILPSLVFLYSGAMIVSIPLMISSLLFAFTHVYISIRNAHA